MNLQLWQEIFGWLLMLTGVLDALKYSLQARKIWKAQSSKNISRRFINWAIVNDVVRIGYGVVLVDWYIILSSLLALVCMIDMFLAQYWWYPYRCRYLINFKRPNIFLYTINSILPNQIRKRL